VAWLLQGHQEIPVFRERLFTRFPLPTVNIILNKEKGLSISRVEFGAPLRSAVHSTLKVETAGGGQEEEEGDAKANEEKDPEVEHEGDGDYEAGSSPAKGGVKGKRMGERSGDRRKPRLHLHLPPTTTVPPVNAILGEEDATVSIKKHRRSSPSPHFSLHRGAGRWVRRRGGFHSGFVSTGCRGDKGQSPEPRARFTKQ